MLRKLIDQARHDPQQQIDDLIRHHQNLAYRFCQALCGDLPNYEDAMRALFASDENGFSGCIDDWPQDLAIRAHALSKPIWQTTTPKFSAQTVRFTRASGVTAPALA